ncbi:hypothetical protein HHI36_004547 [Cryptolaemus montrouzieri]|uniref:Uncharacterized protein n=1 Tax=Cryptolaemus montrouzieri TaxID=559131 RepID=A0ABD2NRQ3_9CUCU
MSSTDAGTVNIMRGYDITGESSLCVWCIVQRHVTASGGCPIFREELQQSRNAKAGRSKESRDSAVSEPRQPTKDKQRTKCKSRATYEEAQTEEHARESSSD